MDVTVIVPVLNEPNLSPFLSSLHRVLRSARLDYEVVVVKGDRETLHAPIPEFQRQRVVTSYGDSLERAILLGFSMAVGDRIVVLDADGSHPPEVIPDLLRGLDAHELAVGTRFATGGSTQDSAFRRFVSWSFTRYAQLIGSNLSDPMSGFFAVRRSLVERTRFKPFMWKIALELEMRSRANPAEVPYAFQKRQRGVSKAKVKTGLRIMWDVFWERM